jgi:hypothetical protein
MIAAVALAGCDGVLLSIGGEFDARLDNYLDLETTVTGLIPTDPTDLPTGDATYTGYALIDADSAAGVETFVADAEILAEFDTNDLSGTVDNVFGDSTGATADTIDITGGSIVGGQFAADTFGTLTIDSTIYDFEGSMIGIFLGPDGDALTALGAGDLYDGLTVDGDFNMTIVGER